MKHLHKSLTVLCLSVALFSCSKKLQTFKFGQPYYQNNTATAQDRVPEAAPVSTDEANVSAQTSSADGAVVTTPEAVAVAKAIKASSTQESTAPMAKETTTKEKLSLKEKLAKKVNKKIQKEMGKSGVSGNLRTGIIVAAIGLLVLIIAGIGGFGGASGVFWILGAIALLIGLIIILLDLI